MPDACKAEESIVLPDLASERIRYLTRGVVSTQSYFGSNWANF